MIWQIRLLYPKSNKLLRIFSHCKTDVKLVLFDSYCTSLYCPFLWTDYTKRTFIKLRVAFNNAYRKIFNPPLWSSANTMYAENNISNFENAYRKIFNPPLWSSACTMYTENNISNFETMLKKSIYRFIQRMQHSDNSLIQCIFQIMGYEI